MKLSVIILNYNVRYFLELCLKSVKAAINDLDAEIIVVDNNSSDNSCEMVKSLFPDVILIENHENAGFSRGNNIGVAKANGEYLCILNPDTVIAEDTFSILLNFMEKGQDLGIVGCRLIDGTGKFLAESKRNIPTPKVSLMKLFGSGNSYYANHVNEKERGKVDVLVGAFMWVKKSLYDEVKGFDEDYFMYGEDIDLSYRVIKKGYQNYYLGDLTAIHFKGESTPKNRVYRKRFYDAMRIFYNKHFKQYILFDVLVGAGTKIIPLLERKHREDNIAENKEVILDNNVMSFKEIIKACENHKGAMRIRPKNANFIVGSSSSKSSGEVKREL